MRGGRGGGTCFTSMNKSSYLMQWLLFLLLMLLLRMLLGPLLVLFWSRLLLLLPRPPFYLLLSLPFLSLTAAPWGAPSWMTRLPIFVAHPAGEEGPPTFCPSTSQPPSNYWSRWGGGSDLTFLRQCIFGCFCFRCCCFCCWCWWWWRNRILSGAHLC